MARQTLDELALVVGKRARLQRILFQHGVANDTALFLPYDRGLGHGPRVVDAHVAPARRA